MAAFFHLDVKPAIAARKRHPQDDVIGYLLAQGASDAEILTECVTCGAAGMITTREFFSVAAWHYLEQPPMRARYLVAQEDERHAMLEEILRLEPVFGHLYRRATADVYVASQGVATVIPKGALIVLRVYATNADETVVGERPLALYPGRELRGDRVPRSLMGFGDGHHRCPCQYVTVQESDIFLRWLLAPDGLRLVRAPSITWNDLIAAYALRAFIVALD